VNMLEHYNQCSIVPKIHRQVVVIKISVKIIELYQAQ
jgi:hypothetical protein